MHLSLFGIPICLWHSSFNFGRCETFMANNLCCIMRGKLWFQNINKLDLLCNQKCVMVWKISIEVDSNVHDKSDDRGCSNVRNRSDDQIEAMVRRETQNLLSLVKSVGTIFGLGVCPT